MCNGSIGRWAGRAKQIIHWMWVTSTKEETSTLLMISDLVSLINNDQHKDGFQSESIFLVCFNRQINMCLTIQVMLKVYIIS